MSRTRLTAVVGAFALVVVAAAAAKAFPEVIPLPNGWRPEGVEAGRQHTLFVSSIPTGAVRQVDVRTGDQFTLVDPMPGRSAIGLEYDRRGERLFVAGGGTGAAYVYDAETGDPIKDYLLTPAAPRFINDVAFTKKAVYFTDSQRPWLYKLSLGHRGALPDAAETVPLSGDYVHQAGFNLNGIVATPNGKTLILVQSNTGKLFTADPKTGVTNLIDVDAPEPLVNGDGILLRGKTLYVVQNRLNKIAVLRLDRKLRSARLVTELTDKDFDVPTTVAALGRKLYAINARFGTPMTPETTYDVVKVG
jgi:sugar lactone lactonase YvrE